MFATYLANGTEPQLGSKKDMWESNSPTNHICDATTKQGKPCQGIAHVAIWCHRFETWTSERIGPYGHSYSTGPSWWDVCNVHQSVPQGYVSSMAYPMLRKLARNTFLLEINSGGGWFIAQGPMSRREAVIMRKWYRTNVTDQLPFASRITRNTD